MGRFIILLILLFFITTSIFGLYTVSSPSMEDTLLTGDRFLTSEFHYGLRLPFSQKVIIRGADPVQGEILAFIYPLDRSEIFIKRCVAVGGQNLKVDNKKLFINDIEVPLSKTGKNADPETIPAGPYGSGKRDFLAQLTVPKDEIFVMGDNRDYSVDSRLWGTLNKKWLKGKALIILFSIDPKVPWKDISHKIRWKRCGMKIQ